MLIDKLFEEKKAFVFDFDDTLYPEKDYLYQIYYMIGQFVEYQETYDHDKITKFLINEFETNGRTNLFDKLIERFELKPEYMENFLRLMRTARLPLPLLLFKEMDWLMNEVVNKGHKLFLLTNGNPEQQYNKIIQIEWNGLQKHIVSYFCDEIKRKPAPDSLLKILNDHQLSPEDVVFIGDSETDKQCAEQSSVDFYFVKDIFN